MWLLLLIRPEITSMSRRLVDNYESAERVVQTLEVATAIFVTAGLVAGNLILFSPLRSDDRGESLSSNSRAAAIKSPAFTATDSQALFDLALGESKQMNTP